MHVGALETLALIASLAAVITDLRTRRIPNWLTAGASLAALGLRVALAGDAAHLGSSLASACLAGALGFGFFLVLSLVGVVGFGDTKLIGAVGLCVGWPLLLSAVTYTFLAGGVLAVGYAAARGKVAAVAQNLGRVHTLTAERVDEEAKTLHVFPYAAAIALGTLWAVLARAWPSIALI